jgi:hypothetical protein
LSKLVLVGVLRDNIGGHRSQEGSTVVSRFPAGRSGA